MKRILLAEDNEVNAKIMTKFLKMNSFEVLVVKDGGEVESAALTLAPDLILMDIQLIGMSGIEAAKAIKKNPALKKLPIIAISAFSKESIPGADLAKLFVDFIEKPVEFNSFCSKISKFIN